MRAVVYVLLVFGLVLGSVRPAIADDQAELRLLVDKAIKAAGGPAKLTRLKSATWKTKGKFFINNEVISFTTEASAQALDQARLEMVAEVNNQTHNFTLIVNRDKGWFKSPKGVEAMPKEVLAMLRADLYALRLVQMLTPLKHKDCKLSALGEIKIGDRPAVGLKAVRKGCAEVDVFFDKETGLPIKCQVQVNEGKNAEQSVMHEFYFSAPKKVDGLVHFTKVVLKRSDKKTFDVDLSDIQAVDAIDAAQFGKPE